MFKGFVMHPVIGPGFCCQAKPRMLLDKCCECGAHAPPAVRETEGKASGCQSDEVEGWERSGLTCSVGLSLYTWTSGVFKCYTILYYTWIPREIKGL